MPRAASETGAEPLVAWAAPPPALEQEEPRRDGRLARLALHNLLCLSLFALMFVCPVLRSSSGSSEGGGSSQSVEGEWQADWRSSQAAVRRDSHAYLREALGGDQQEHAFVRDVDAVTVQNAQQLAAAGEESFYLAWIIEDLMPWRARRIQQADVEAAARLWDACDGELLRFQVVNGSLWVQHISERLSSGWFPGSYGPGNVAAKGRVPYILLALLETLRAFPGQVPDVDAVIHTSDFPCLRRTAISTGADQAGGVGQAAGRTVNEQNVTPLPLLGYSTSADAWDIPFPDYSFWGHEQQHLQDPWGRPAVGWPAQAAILRAKYSNVSLSSRLPQAVWRGRYRDKRYPYRDRLRRRFLACPDRLRAAGLPAAAALFSTRGPPAATQDYCDFRFPLYIESHAWSSGLRHRLACGSVVVAPRLRHFEWWSRALVPGVHYVEVLDDEGQMCEQIARAVSAMNVALDAGRKPPSWQQPSGGGGGTPTLAERRAALLRNATMAALLSQGSAQLLGLDSSSARSQGSGLAPQRIAAAGFAFAAEHVRGEDALLYIRDLLKQYAAVQGFAPQPLPKAACYDGPLLLEQFSTPHASDGALVAAAYPWLPTHDGGCGVANAARGLQHGQSLWSSGQYG